MLKVGYGAMVLESLLAVIALCVAGAAASANGTPADGTPFQVFSSGVAGFFEMFGIPVYVAQCFMTMCVSALALTSLDAVARIGRMSFQELFSVDDMTHAEGWRKLLCNTYFSTIVTLLAAFILTRIGSVSYTHLDVYKRQGYYFFFLSNRNLQLVRMGIAKIPFSKIFLNLDIVKCRKKKFLIILSSLKGIP